jgi:surface antigen
MRKTIAVLALSLPLGLGACAQPGYYGGGYGGRAAPGEVGVNKTTGGALVGAGLGGLAGSQLGHGTGKLAATGAGVILGALLGGSVGQSLDRADLAYASRTTQSTLETVPSGQPVAWRNPDSGNAGTIVARPAYQAPSGQFCREFQQTITVGGQTQEGFGTACRQPDGSWKIVQ